MASTNATLVVSSDSAIPTSSPVTMALCCLVFEILLTYVSLDISGQSGDDIAILTGGLDFQHVVFYKRSIAPGNHNSKMHCF